MRYAFGTAQCWRVNLERHGRYLKNEIKLRASYIVNAQGTPGVPRFRRPNVLSRATESNAYRQRRTITERPFIRTITLVRLSSENARLHSRE